MLIILSIIKIYFYIDKYLTNNFIYDNVYLLKIIERLKMEFQEHLKLRKQLRKARIIANLISFCLIVLAFGMAWLKWIY